MFENKLNLAHTVYGALGSVIPAITGVVISFPIAARASRLHVSLGLGPFCLYTSRGACVAAFLAVLWFLLFVRIPLHWATEKIGIALAIVILLNSLSPLLFLAGFPIATGKG